MRYWQLGYIDIILTNTHLISFLPRDGNDHDADEFRNPLMTTTAMILSLRMMLNLRTTPSLRKDPATPLSQRAVFSLLGTQQVTGKTSFCIDIFSSSLIFLTLGPCDTLYLPPLDYHHSCHDSNKSRAHNSRLISPTPQQPSTTEEGRGILAVAILQQLTTTEGRSAVAMAVEEEKLAVVAMVVDARGSNAPLGMYVFFLAIVTHALLQPLSDCF